MNLEHVWILFTEDREQDGSRLGGYWVKERGLKHVGCSLGDGWELIVRGLGTDKDRMGAGKEKVV